MARMASLGHAQAVEIRHHGTHRLVASKVSAVGAPSSHHHAGAARKFNKVLVILWSDWVYCCQHVGRLGRAEREQIGHAKRAITPSFCECHAAPNCWVVQNLVSRARI